MAAGAEWVDGAVWEVSRPKGGSRVPGVSMAGFGDRGMTPEGLRLIPHPGVTVALLFGGGSVSVADEFGRELSGSLVAGLGFGAARLRRAVDFQCLQVRLSPAIARAVLGPVATELAGSMVMLDDLWGREAPRIGEQLAGASSWDERFALTDNWLAQRLATGTPPSSEVSWAWRQIVDSRGQLRIDELAVELGWSRKRLWSRFGSQLGVPPTRAASLVRFDHAAHELVAGHNAARVAADTGYADQSHLHRDVMAFTGTTPALLRDEPFLTIDDLAWPATIQPAVTPKIQPVG
ncbi:helix-turn-helix domain-containing protein [Kribbella sp. NPDC023855]|uniref:AraC family transcriptional regulator n=1 Tax=Kribbella sp. NPDC023855 TaxID=3154698 RepID=UPI0033D5EDCC